MKVIALNANNAEELPVGHVQNELVETGSIEELQVLQLAVAIAYEQCEPGNHKAMLVMWSDKIKQAIKDAQYELGQLPF